MTNGKGMRQGLMEGNLRLIVVAVLLVVVSCDQYLTFRCELLDLAETKEVIPARVTLSSGRLRRFADEDLNMECSSNCEHLHGRESMRPLLAVLVHRLRLETQSDTIWCRLRELHGRSFRPSPRKGSTISGQRTT